MRIGVDAHVLAGKYQGSRTYILRLYQAILAANPQDEFVFFGHWSTIRPFGEQVEYIEYPSHSRLKRLTYQSLPLLKRAHLDIFHTNYISPLLIPCRSLVTVHDLLFETHPQYFTRGEIMRNRLLVRNSVRHSAQVHTVSQFSKHALINLYHVPEHKIFIVPNGIDIDRFYDGNRDAAIARLKQKYGIADYLLSVGRLEPRKNHVTLIRAYARARAISPDLGPLIIIGQRDFGYEQIFAVAEECQLGSFIHFLDSIPDDELVDFYRAAHMFVYPSYAEGFGIPPLEAMAAGIPVITSNTTAFPEVVGDAGIVIHPDNINDIADEIVRLHLSPTMREDLAIRGIIRAKHWSWQNAGQRFIEAIAQLR
jgi:glycosyltransferase involved in cell wall biosynthesis